MIAVIDFETTGLKAGVDEILQVSIIDENYNTLFNTYCKPLRPSGGDKREIRFRNGYGSSRPEFIALCTLDIKTGREEWGAEPGKEYYTLKIHEIRERRGC